MDFFWGLLLQHPVHLSKSSAGPLTSREIPSGLPRTAACVSVMHSQGRLSS